MQNKYDQLGRDGKVAAHDKARKMSISEAWDSIDFWRSAGYTPCARRQLHIAQATLEIKTGAAA